MLLIIPLGGIGKRFSDYGYKEIKPFIKCYGKEILFWVLDNLNLNKINKILIPYNKDLINFERIIKHEYPKLNILFLKLENNTRGPVESILNILNKYNEEDEDILSVDGDNFYYNDIISDLKDDNLVFTFNDKNNNPIYSYIRSDKNSNILEIKEKEKISNKACTGAYYFKSWKLLKKYCKYIIDNNIRFKNEFYLSNVIDQMINDNIKFKYKNTNNYHSLGTPNLLHKFQKYTFLFDLDGTLVNTDHIYLITWKKILKEYNINIDKIFFNTFIAGKSDNNFLKFLIPNITNEKINEISNLKDSIFIENIKKDNNILLNGVIEFMEKIKDSNIAIVTNSNRKSAEFVINYTGLNKYVKLLISSNDCINKKPHPEPYLKAINYFNINNNDCIIFEDSGTGYLSAKATNPYKIILIKSDNEYINNLNEYKIQNYMDIDIINIIKPIINNIYINKIKQELSYLPIKEIIYNNINLKTGYICNISSYNIELNNNNNLNIILKISNLDNELSKTALKLDMYKNETYFYNNLNKQMFMINIPKYYGKINEDDKEGILIEDLNKLNGTFNINLNNNINIVTNIINNIFKLHSIYFFNSEEEIISDMKNLKKFNEIKYYFELINNRFEKFLKNIYLFTSKKEREILTNIFNNFNKISDRLSNFPLSFCHGDFKSPNIFYKDNTIPYFLDWQYIHLNKGISDVVFLCIESLDFDITTLNLIFNYYYQLIKENIKNYSYDDYLIELKCSLCGFAFFVCVWFNSEDSDKLIDKSFPLRFLKNLLKYYKYYINDDFFNKL